MAENTKPDTQTAINKGEIVTAEVKNDATAISKKTARKRTTKKKITAKKKIVSHSLPQDETLNEAASVVDPDPNFQATTEVQDSKQHIPAETVQATADAAAQNGKKGMSLWLKATIWVVVIVVDIFILWYLAEGPSNIIDTEKDQVKTASVTSLQKNQNVEVSDNVSDKDDSASAVRERISSTSTMEITSNHSASTEFAPQIIKSGIDSSPPSQMADTERRVSIEEAEATATQNVAGSVTQKSARIMMPSLEYTMPTTGLQFREKRVNDLQTEGVGSNSTIDKAAASTTEKSLPPAGSKVSTPAAVSTPLQSSSQLPATMPNDPNKSATAVRERKLDTTATAREPYYGYRQRPRPGMQRQPIFPQSQIQAYPDRAVERGTRQSRTQRGTPPYYPRTPWGYHNPRIPYSGYGGGYQPYPDNRAYTAPVAPPFNTRENAFR